MLKPEAESLSKSILELAKDRNRVAHNPIASSDAQFIDPYVLVVRHGTGFPPKIETIDRAGLERIANRSREVMKEFVRLFPNAPQFEPLSP